METIYFLLRKGESDYASARNNPPRRCMKVYIDEWQGGGVDVAVRCGGELVLIITHDSSGEPTPPGYEELGTK